MPKKRRPKEQGPQKRARHGHNDAKGDRDSSKVATKGRHEPVEPSEKKSPSQFVPSTARQMKAARLRAGVHNNQGRSRGLWETAAFLHMIVSLFLAHQDGSLLTLAMLAGAPDWSRFVRFGCDLIGMSYALGKSTFDTFYTYRDGGYVEVNETPRGRGSEEYNLNDARQLKPEHHAAIDAFVLERHGKKGGGRVTIPNLQKMLRQTFKVPAEPGAGTQEQPFLVSKGVIRYCMVHQLGYHWGRIRLKKNTADSNRPAMVRSYLKRYADALELERQGVAVICYFDERCVCDNECYFCQRLSLKMCASLPNLRSSGAGCSVVTYTTRTPLARPGSRMEGMGG